jgi:hypothetical protein
MTSGLALRIYRSGCVERETYGRVDSYPFGVLLAAGLALELERPVEVGPNRLQLGKWHGQGAEQDVMTDVGQAIHLKVGDSLELSADENFKEL